LKRATITTETKVAKVRAKSKTLPLAQQTSNSKHTHHICPATMSMMLEWQTEAQHLIRTTSCKTDE